MAVSGALLMSDFGGDNVVIRRDGENVIVHLAHEKGGTEYRVSADKATQMGQLLMVAADSLSTGRID